MSILSGNRIKQCVEWGSITIDPFNEENINPVSYDVTLGRQVKIFTYRDDVIDPKVPFPPLSEIEIDDYIVIVPNELYLMHTIERVYTESYVPIMDGKSSIARLGVSIHQTAGFGDPGYDGQYTLEVTCILPVKLYPGMKIGQFRFHTIQGDITSYRKKGNYTGRQVGANTSKSYNQFGK